MAVALEQILVDFPGTRALAGVDFEVAEGEVHGIVGENGAGKSTLVSVLAGALAPTEGDLHVDGQPRVFHGPKDALASGIAYVSQEVSLIPHLSGAQNIMLGQEPRRFGIINQRRLREQAQALASRFFPESPIALGRRVDELGYAHLKVIEILRALAANARIIILDEPTASLPGREKAQLFELIHALKQRGVGFVLISHFLHEVLGEADRVTILRDGQHIETVATAGLQDSYVVERMLSRANAQHAVENERPAEAVTGTGPVRLAVTGWTGPGFGPVDLTVERGEVVALIGLAQAGHLGFAESLFDGAVHEAGEIALDDTPIRLHGPRDALSAGIAMVPDNRMVKALFGDWSVGENLSLMHLGRTRQAGLPLIDRGRERRYARDVIERFAIKTRGPQQPIQQLSGGNKQKVSIARWFFGTTVADSYRLAIFVEPTEGVDVGVKAEIHRAIAQMAAAGVSVLLVSSDLKEVSALADRVLVFTNGKPEAEVARRDFDEQRFARLMAGGSS